MWRNATAFVGRTGWPVDHTQLTSIVDAEGGCASSISVPASTRGVPARSPEPAAPGMMRLERPLVGLVSRAPAQVQTKLLAAFLAIVVLLIALGAVGLEVLSGMNRRTEELISSERKIAAYRQVQHDTISQLYSVSSALLVRTTAPSTARCASSTSSATTSKGCNSSPRTKSNCSARSGRITTGSSRS